MHVSELIHVCIEILYTLITWVRIDNRALTTSSKRAHRKGKEKKKKLRRK
jgi:hypothetical protein